MFHDTEYGGDVSSMPRSALSSLNCTPATLTLSEAEAETTIVPDTLDPSLGLVSAAVGGSVSENASSLNPGVIRHPGFVAKPSVSYAPTSKGEVRELALKSAADA